MIQNPRRRRAGFAATANTKPISPRRQSRAVFDRDSRPHRARQTAGTGHYGRDRRRPRKGHPPGQTARRRSFGQRHRFRGRGPPVFQGAAGRGRGGAVGEVSPGSLTRHWPRPPRCCSPSRRGRWPAPSKPTNRFSSSAAASPRPPARPDWRKCPKADHQQADG